MYPQHFEINQLKWKTSWAPKCNKELYPIKCGCAELHIGESGCHKVARMNKNTKNTSSYITHGRRDTSTTAQHACSSNINSIHWHTKNVNSWMKLQKNDFNVWCNNLFLISNRYKDLPFVDEQRGMEGYYSYGVLLCASIVWSMQYL